MKNDENAVNLREVLPRFCRQFRPVSSGTEMSPGEARVLEAGTLCDTAFPDLIVVAGSFEVDEISLAVNAGRRVVFSSRARDDRTDLASFVGLRGRFAPRASRSIVTATARTG